MLASQSVGQRQPGKNLRVSQLAIRNSRLDSTRLEHEWAILIIFCLMCYDRLIAKIFSIYFLKQKQNKNYSKMLIRRPWPASRPIGQSVSVHDFMKFFFVLIVSRNIFSINLSSLSHTYYYHWIKKMFPYLRPSLRAMMWQVVSFPSLPAYSRWTETCHADGQTMAGELALAGWLGQFDIFTLTNNLPSYQLLKR